MAKWKMTSAMKRRIEAAMAQQRADENNVPRYDNVVQACREEKCSHPEEEAMQLIRGWIMGEKKTLRAIGSQAFESLWWERRAFQEASKKLRSALRIFGCLDGSA